jgi:hypothetical protein
MAHTAQSCPPSYPLGSHLIAWLAFGKLALTSAISGELVRFLPKYAFLPFHISEMIARAEEGKSLKISRSEQTCVAASPMVIPHMEVH